MSSTGTSAHDPKERLAFAAGLAAFVFWGVIPIYWKLMRSVPAHEILAHRFVWTTVFLVVLLSWQGRWDEVRTAFRSRRALLFCIGTGCFISVNWLLFIWAVNSGRILETSLGYFINPLVNVLLGALFLRERLTRLQFVSVLLATCGVLNLSFSYGQVPWVALVLAGSFGMYGLLRKVAGTAAVPGMFIETAVLMPVALIYLLVLAGSGTLQFGPQLPSLSVLLMFSGIATGLPLVWFGFAARHLRLTTVGFLQYIAPSCTFFIGVFMYDEPFTRAHLITFGLIWVALAIFTTEAVWRWSSAARPGSEAEETPGPVPESAVAAADRKSY